MLKENIKLLRRSKGLSQEELAVRAQCGEADCLKMGKMVFLYWIRYAHRLIPGI